MPKPTAVLAHRPGGPAPCVLCPHPTQLSPHRHPTLVLVHTGGSLHLNLSPPTGWPDAISRGSISGRAPATDHPAGGAPPPGTTPAPRGPEDAAPPLAPVRLLRSLPGVLAAAPELLLVAGRAMEGSGRIRECVLCGRMCVRARVRDAWWGRHAQGGVCSCGTTRNKGHGGALRSIHIRMHEQPRSVN